MKFKEVLIKIFTKNIPLKLLALAFSFLLVVLINAV